MAVNIRVKVHPVVLFQIADAYERRDMEKFRVIGTLLGSIDKQTVEVKNCYCVPHKDHNDRVEIDIVYNQDMMVSPSYQVCPDQKVVGWFSTGVEVMPHSSNIHDYYSRETKDPIHLTVDTSLRNGKMDMKAYVFVSFGVPGKTSGSMFAPIPVEITGYGAEISGLDLLQKCITNKSRQAQIIPGLAKVNEETDNLMKMLSEVLDYVTGVLEGRIAPNNEIGRKLMNLVNSVPKMTPDEFDKMITSNKNDLLMVIYLTQLTKTQLQLHEKLTAVSVNQLKDYQKLIPE